MQTIKSKRVQTEVSVRTRLKGFLTGSAGVPPNAVFAKTKFLGPKDRQNNRVGCTSRPSRSLVYPCGNPAMGRH
jgi:hypothetical protein